jgi:hypothetical protein
MANPRNPLDVYATYTYHFELHAAANWDDLAQIQNTDQNLITSATHKTKTLLINTRRDAHQIIDDVKFGYIGPSANNHGHFIPDGSMTFTVSEPTRVFFMEKIANTMKEYNVSSLSNLHWALKIFFLGRKSDGTVQKVPAQGTGITIPMAFVDMDSNFSYKGGEYHMSFVTLASFAGSNNDKAMSSVMLAGYCNKNVSVAAKKVKEALSLLEQQLNDNYKKTYEVELKNPGIRPLVYKINVDPSIPDGFIDYSSNGDSSANGDTKIITFSPDETIVSWIYTILRSSDRLNSMVGESLKGIRQAGHPGVKILSIFPTFLATAKELTIYYNIILYQGENTEINGLQNNTNAQKNVMEFDFMFGSPGHNVDVLGFDMHMKSALAWLSNNTETSVVHHTQLGGESPAKAVSTDTVQRNTPSITTERYLVPGGPGIKNDIAYLPANPQADSSGQIKYKESAVKNAKIMFNSITQMHAAFDPMFTFTIRGHLDLLTAGVVYPITTVGDLHKLPFGVRSPLWVKVNIKSPNDQKTAFFYNGLYNVISIENHFQGGKFIQTLAVLMMGGMESNSTLQSINDTPPSGDVSPDTAAQIKSVSTNNNLTIIERRAAITKLVTTPSKKI